MGLGSKANLNSQASPFSEG